MRASSAFVGALALLSTALVTADLPVHCLHKHIRGKWTFHLSKANLSKEGIKCSDTASNDFSSEENNFALGNPNYKVHKKIKVELLHPNIAKTSLNGKEHMGTWTMIYDEGFEVDVAGTKFFAFSKYTGSKDNEYSHCGETFPGWYHPSKMVDAKQWGCYHGIKDTKVASQKFRKFGSRPISTDDVYVHEEELIQTVNNMQTSWTARRYPEHEGRPMALVQKNMGQVTRPYKLLATDRAEQAKWADDSKVDISDVPKAWDWRNVQGVNFMGPVVNQGSCGSCYSVAVSEMISTRMRILSRNKQKHHMSADRVLKCGIYSQGCQGGFPYLASKFLQDFGSVSEHTQPYTDMDGKCPKLSSDKVASRNTGYKYVGGYYGACGERAMMRELYDHGPFVVGFEVGDGFQAYGSGVYKAESKLPIKNHYERVNHAVLITGFGEDHTGLKYWLVKNSWGYGWGEDGYFRIKRGDDNLNIEHMAVAAYPTIGAKFPPAQGELFMTSGSVSQGKTLMAELPATMTATGAKGAGFDKDLHIHSGGEIQDPAFLRGQQAEAPAIAEVQEMTDTEVPPVVEQVEGVEWPEA